MVEGLFAGYKLQRDAKWRGEYLVYDRLSYENWTGTYELPVHEAKELYIPGSAADSRDASSSFQLPVKDGDWKSMAEEANRYVRNRRYKKKNKPEDDTVTTSMLGSGQLSMPHLEPTNEKKSDNHAISDRDNADLWATAQATVHGSRHGWRVGRLS